MKKLILLTAITIITLNSFSQKKDTIPNQKHVLVEFQDSTSYLSFLNYLGSLRADNPASQLYNYFKSLPAQLVADKPKTIKK